MKLDGFHPTHTSTADLEPVDGPSTREGPSGGRRDVQDSSKGLESAHLWGAGGVTGAAEGIHGDEDYNNNGVPDAVELAKCLEKRPDNLASTGVSLWSWVFGAIALVGLGTGISGVARRTVEVSK